MAQPTSAMSRDVAKIARAIESTRMIRVHLRAGTEVGYNLSIARQNVDSSTLAGMCLAPSAPS